MHMPNERSIDRWENPYRTDASSSSSITRRNENQDEEDERKSITIPGFFSHIYTQMKKT